MKNKDVTIDARGIRAGIVMPVEDIMVGTYAPGPPDAQMPPTQVHVTFRGSGLPHEFVIEFKSRKPAEWFCATIMKHVNGVWPDRS